MKDFIEEFGFYIFILFSSFIVSLFESVFPKRVPYENLYAKALMLESVLEEKLASLSRGIFTQNVLVLALSFIALFVIIFSFLLFMFQMYRISRLKPVIKKAGYSPCPYWNLKDFFKIVIWIIFFMQMLALSDDVFTIFDKSFSEKDYIVLSLATSLFLDLIVIAIVIYWLKKRYNQTLSALGISKNKLFKNFISGAVYYFSFLPVVIILLYISSVYLQKYQYVVSPQLLFQFLFFEKNPWVLGLTVLFIVVIGPFIEEVFFRGLFYTTLKKSIGTFQAMLATSILFSLLHMNPIGFLPIFGLALLFTTLYEKTGSLLVSFFAHMLHNGFLIYLIFTLRISLGL